MGKLQWQQNPNYLYSDTIELVTFLLMSEVTFPFIFKAQGYKMRQIIKIQ